MTINIVPPKADDQTIMDLEDVAIRHNQLVRLLQAEHELDVEVKRLTLELQSAKRKLKRVKEQIRDQSRLEVLRTSLPGE